MSVMSAPDVWSGQERLLTVDDMEDMPDDEFRYELDDGVLIVSPVPSSLHQLAVTRLTLILSAVCPAELVVLAGIAVNITRFQHRVPDLAVVRADSFGTTFQESPPALAVEVASPRTGLYDRSRKKDVYEKFGIPSYWIFTPARECPELTIFELRSGSYEMIVQLSGDDSFGAELPFPVTVVPSRLVTTGPLG
jgi:Uma2 family endonuclease